MMPWPIALLTLFYGVIAAASAAAVWKIVIGVSQQSALWPIAWLAVSAALMCGLPMLKSWARRLAVFASLAMMLMTLALAALLVMKAQPLFGLSATLGAAVHILVIRYLQRPMVKAYFAGTANQS